MRTLILSIILGLGSTLPSSTSAQQVKLGSRNVLQVMPSLKPGEFIWAPELTDDGPALVIVNLETQRLVMFRNGVPIAASTVSSGKTGHETPMGVFTILEKSKEHHSKTYDNASMPNMQRLTWKGIALHAGNLPGYPASHGCVRLPLQFSALLFGATNLGMTVVITSLPNVPHDAAEPAFINNAAPGLQPSFSKAPYEWHPEGSPDDPLSVVISASDQRAIIVRDGKEIGSGPVHVSGPINGGVAYVLRSWDQSGKHWLRLQYSGTGGSMDVPSNELDRFDTPVSFRAAVAAAVRPGTVIVVTTASLKSGSTGAPATVFESDKASR